MKSLTRRVLCVIVGIGLVSAALPAAAQASPTMGSLVSVDPSVGTPHVLNGRVNSIARIAGRVILGGQFTQAREDASATVLSRTNLLAFDEATGLIDASFLPVTNGPVNVVLPAPDGQSVYVGGSFNTVNGVTVKNLVRIRISDGSIVSTFNPATVAGQVKDLKLSGGRLWVGGAFTHIAQHAQLGLATVNPDTGAYLPFMHSLFTGTHNGGWTSVMKFDITPDGTKLLAIGNFDMVDGVKTHQAAMFDLSGSDTVRAPWQTAFYETMCSASFDTYMRDLDIAPNGAFAVISTTGAYGGAGAACDSTARFEMGTTGSGILPSWVANTGGDTTYAVEVTDSVVYTGGHARWQNNPFAGDRAGQGAVSRPGIAALDPINGLPFTWNPTRDRGVGVFDFVQAPTGLYVGSDTDSIGPAASYHGRIALMPNAGGSSFPVVVEPTLPNDLYVAATSGVTRRRTTAASFGASAAVNGGGLTWANVKGAFMLNGYLYTAWADGSFDRRTFDGTSYGAVEPVNTQDMITPLTDWKADIQAMTGMFYDRGRIYFTKTGSSLLFYRYFTPENKVVGARRLTASPAVTGFNPTAARGMFAADGQLYFADALGNLSRIDWLRGPISGAPTAGTASIVSGPGVDGLNWTAKAFFLYQDIDGNNAPDGPVASFTSSCPTATCTFDASGSSSPGSTITDYAWDFGDGTTGNGVTPSHTYAAAGAYPVTLTVTNSAALTGSSTLTVTAGPVNNPPTASFTGSCTGTSCAFNASGSTDPEGNITAYAWDFGDGTTGTGLTTTHLYAAPGDYTVSLTVTDALGETSTTSRTITVTVLNASLQFVEASTSNGNRTAHTVTVPATAQVGDTLVMVFAVNGSTTPTAPAGWTLVTSGDPGTFLVQAWTKRATAADIGQPVTITTASLYKSDLTVAAYRMSDGSLSSVTSGNRTLIATSTSSLTTPTVSSPSARAWLISFWTVKSSTGVTITVPASQQQRGGGSGTGGGAVFAALTDGNGPVGSGTKGGLTATTSVAVSRAVTMSLVIAPS